MTLFWLSMAVTAVLLLILSFFTWGKRATPGSRFLTLLLVMTAFWLAGYVIEIVVSGFSAKLLWMRLQYISNVTVPTIWLIFALQYTRQERWLTHPIRWLLLIEPLLQLLLLLTDGRHNLLWRQLSLDINHPIPVVLFTRGPANALHILYIYLLLLAGASLLFRAIVRSPHVPVRQITYVIAVSLIPWLFSIFAFLIVPPQIRLGTFAFAIVSPLLALVFLQFRSINTLPAARVHIVDSMKDAMLVVNAQNQLVDFNQAAEKVIGQALHDYLGQSAINLFSDQPDLVSQFTDVTEAHTEIAIALPTDTLYFDLQISPIWDEDGRLQGRTIVWRDITKHKQTEEALKRRNLILETLNEIAVAVSQSLNPQEILNSVAILTTQALDVTSVIICDWQVESSTATVLANYFHQTAVDDKSATMVGKSYHLADDFGDHAEWLQNADSYYIAHTDDPDLPPLKRAYFQKHGIISAIDVPLWRGDRAVGFIEAWESRPQREFSQEDVALVQAITRQVVISMHNGELYQSLQNNLRRTEALYQVAQTLSAYADLPTLLTAVANQVAAALPTDRVSIITINQEARKIIHFVSGGSGGDEIVRVDYDELEVGLSGYALRTLEPVVSPKAPPDPRESPAAQKRRRDTNTGAVLVIPLHYRGQILGTMAGINRSDERDFTSEDVDLMMAMGNQTAVAIENARLYEAARERANMLETQNEELDAYAHTVAHDLKSPLAVIVGYADYLQDTARQEAHDLFVKYTGTIAEYGRKMSSIVENLLLLATVRKTEAETERLDMGAIVHEVLKRLHYQISQCGGQVHVADEWPQAWGYAPWVEEVWVNYLSNALKYGGQPPIVELGAALEDEQRVRFWVRDNGSGIPAEQLEQLFVAFERLDQTKIEGHGLGLSIVQRIMRKMNGEVGVQSTPGEGTVFSFTLPLNDQNAP